MNLDPVDGILIKSKTQEYAENPIESRRKINLMSVKKILEEDWSEYDDRKIRDKRDSKDFACTEVWEVDYLKDKIKKHYPKLSDADILAAIKACCSTIGSPHPRKKFVECVATRLGIPAV